LQHVFLIYFQRYAFIRRIKKIKMPLINKVASALATAIAPPNNAVESEGILSVHAIYLGSVKVRPRDIVSALSRLALDTNGSSTAAVSSFSWNTSAHAGRRSRAAMLSSVSTAKSGRGGSMTPAPPHPPPSLSSSTSGTTPLRAQELPVVALCADALALELVGHALGNIRAEFDALRNSGGGDATLSSSSKSRENSRSRRASSQGSSHQRQSQLGGDEEEEEENKEEMEEEEDYEENEGQKNEGQRRLEHREDIEGDEFFRRRPHVDASSRRGHLRRVSHLKKLSRAIERRTMALETQLRPHGVTASDYRRGRAELLNRWALAALPPLPSTAMAVPPTSSSVLNDSLLPDESNVDVRNETLPPKIATTANHESGGAGKKDDVDIVVDDDKNGHVAISRNVRDSMFLLPTMHVNNEANHLSKSSSTEVNTSSALAESSLQPNRSENLQQQQQQQRDQTAVNLQAIQERQHQHQLQQKHHHEHSLVTETQSNATKTGNPNAHVHAQLDNTKDVLLPQTKREAIGDSNQYPKQLQQQQQQQRSEIVEQTVVEPSSETSRMMMEFQKRNAEETAAALSALQEAVVAVSKSDRSVIEGEISALWQERVRVSDLSRLDAEHRCESLSAQLKNANVSIASLQRRLSLLEEERKQAVQSAELQRLQAIEAKESLAQARETFSSYKKDTQLNFEKSVTEAVAQAMEIHTEATERELSAKLSIIVAERNAGLSVLQELRDAEMEAEKVLSTKLMEELNEAKAAVATSQHALEQLRAETDERIREFSRQREIEEQRHINENQQEAHEAIAAAAAAVKAHEKTIEELSKELESALQDCDQLSVAENEAESAREEAAELRAETARLNEQVLSLTLACRMSDAKYASLESQIAELHSSSKNRSSEESETFAKERIDRLISEKSNLELKVAELSSKVETTEKEMKAAKVMAEDANKASEAAKNKTDAVRMELENAKMFLEATVVDIETLRKDNLDAKSRFNALQLDADALRREVAQLQEVRESLTIERDELISRILSQERTHSDSLTVLQQHLVNLQSQLDELRSTEAGLNSVLTVEQEKFNTSISNLNATNEALTATNEALSAANEALTTKTEAFNAANVALTSTNETLNAANVALTAKNVTLHTANEALIVKNEALERSLNESNDSLKSLQESNDSFRAIEASLLQRLASEKEHVHKVVDELQQERKSLVAMTRQVDVLRNAEIRLRKDIEERSNTIIALEEKVANLKESLHNDAAVFAAERSAFEIELDRIRETAQAQASSQIEQLMHTHREQLDQIAHSHAEKMKTLRAEAHDQSEGRLDVLRVTHEAALKALKAQVDLRVESSELELRQLKDELSVAKQQVHLETEELRIALSNSQASLIAVEAVLEEERRLRKFAEERASTTIANRSLNNKAKEEEADGLRSRIEDLSAQLHRDGLESEALRKQLKELRDEGSTSSVEVSSLRRRLLEAERLVQEKDRVLEVEKLRFKEEFEEERARSMKILEQEMAKLTTAIANEKQSIETDVATAAAAAAAAEGAAWEKAVRTYLDSLHSYSQTLRECDADVSSSASAQQQGDGVDFDPLNTSISSSVANQQFSTILSSALAESEDDTGLQVLFKKAVSDLVETVCAHYSQRVSAVTARVERYSSRSNDRWRADARTELEASFKKRVAEIEERSKVAVSETENAKLALSARVSTAEATLLRLEEEKAKIAERLAQVEDARAIALERLTLSEDDRADLLNRIADLKDELAHSHEEALDAKATLKKLRREFAEAVAQHDAALAEAATALNEAKSDLKSAVAGFEARLRAERSEAELLLKKAVEDALDHERQQHAHSSNTTQHAGVNTTQNVIRNALVGSSTSSPQQQQQQSQSSSFISPVLSTPGGLWLSSPSAPLSASSSSIPTPADSAHALISNTSMSDVQKDLLDSSSVVRTSASAAYPAFSRRRDSVQQQLIYSRRQSQDSSASSIRSIGGTGVGGHDTSGAFGASPTLPNLPSSTELVAVKRKVAELSEGVRERDGLLTSAEREMAVLYERLAEAVQTISVLQSRLLSTQHNKEATPTTLVPKELLDESLRQINAARTVFSKESHKGLDAFRKRKKALEEQGQVETADFESQWVDIVVTPSDSTSSSSSSPSSLSSATSLRQLYLLVNDVLRAARSAGASAPVIASGINDSDIDSNTNDDLLEDLLREADRNDVKGGGSSLSGGGGEGGGEDDKAETLAKAIEGLQGVRLSAISICFNDLRKEIAKAALLYSKSLNRMQAALRGKDLLNLTLQSETIAYEGMLVQARRLSQASIY